MSAYALAVREIVETCPEIGPIDTWQKLADRIYTPQSDPDRASRSRKQSLLRKKLSRHFTAESKGPPWQTVMLVVKHALPPEFRRQWLADLAELYELARGERPPNGVRDEPAENRTEVRDGHDLERCLRQKIADLERECLDLRVEVSELRAAQTTRSLGPTSDDLPRQREPLSGSSTPTPNARHFPPNQARAGGPAQSHYQAPRLDTGSPGLPGQNRGDLGRLVDKPWHVRQPQLDSPNSPHQQP
ncbi:hypothetical protein ACGFIW_32135 [Micromonospora sp. NPDC048935]|uniref:hypothetical protein n=1 Tax=Micromonospora sp. NPDC048935 TaxID=3364262 RepID=UPI0037198689